MPKPRIALIGAGPVGCLLATALAHNGHQCHWVVRNDVRRQNVRHLRLMSGEEAMDLDHSHWNILRDSGELSGQYDWLLLAVKAQQAQILLDSLSGTLSTDCLIVANGLHHLQVHLGLLYGGALLKTGLLQTGTGNRLVIGPLPGVNDKADNIARKLNCPWLLVGGKEEIVARMWHKLALNCVVNPLTVMFDCLNGQLPLYTQYPLIQGILSEVVAVARAELGDSWRHTITGLFRDLESLIRDTASNSSSMREDLRNGRETEISKLNQAIVERGQLHGIDCATNSYLCNMVSILANK